MKTIALITFDNFTDIDLFLMWDILGRNTDDWNVRILAASPRVRSSNGLFITVHGPLCEANRADVVLIASGKQGIPDALSDPNFLPSLKLDPSKQYIGSICAGAFVLESLGLLPTRRATTHPDARGSLEALGVEPIDSPLVCHGRVATAGGCLAALYLVGWAVESLFNPDKRRATLQTVLPTGQQEVFQGLIDATVQEGMRGSLS